MKTTRKPRIGFLGLITDGYEQTFKGILARQEKYAHEVIATVSDVVDITFNGIATNQQEIIDIVSDYNSKKLDGIWIVLLAYSQGAWILRAMKDNKLPIALTVIQPDQEVLQDWDELDFTVNQGIHGAQDNCNVLHRLGVKYQVFAGNRHEQRFVDFIQDFGKAAQAFNRLKMMKIAIFSRMQGMGDVLTDDFGVFKTLGTEFCHDTIGTIYRYMQEITADEIDAQIEKDKSDFTIDTKLTYESHSEAVKMYLAFKKYLEKHEYDGFTAHFDQFSDDGRFKQLPLYAASQLMNDGYGYAAEGDSMCATMVAALHEMGEGKANFTEMYGMDFKEKAIVFCHAGEGNWGTVDKEKKPNLIDRYLGEGGLENPPTIMFTPKHGAATLSSLVSLGGNKFRLVVAMGTILPKSDLTGCEMPYLFWRPDTTVENCVEEWLRNGGTHHEVICLGNVCGRLKMLCNMLDIEYKEI